jgi:hypothetical protein
MLPQTPPPHVLERIPPAIDVLLIVDAGLGVLLSPAKKLLGKTAVAALPAVGRQSMSFRAGRAGSAAR